LVAGPDGLRPLRLGWWNLEFFGNRNDPPRTEEDLQAIAGFVRGLDVQVLGVCEVDGPKPLQDLCRRLGPEWKFAVGRSGYLGQDGHIAPGIIWDNSRVEMLGAGELESLRRAQLFHRIPVTAAFACISKPGASRTTWRAGAKKSWRCALGWKVCGIHRMKTATSW
jgi:hypothetical protein